MRELTGLPAGVIGFETTGWVHASDYRDLVTPAVERAAGDGKIRCVIVIDDFGGLTPAALVHDLRMGFGNLRSWKRIALVTDVSWLSWTTATLGWMSPGELKRFSLADRDEAIAWAAGLPKAAVAPKPSYDAGAAGAGAGAGVGSDRTS
jgi:hypothetical protein